VLHNGKEIRACITPVAAVATGSIVTSDGLPQLWQSERGTAAAGDTLHPVQQAWIDEQVPQCGYCQNGMMIKATELLTKVKRPTEDQIRSHMNTHLCRCGTYTRIVKAVQRAGKAMA
jgi:isoquinoline 1-oxidoreductase alpha subunit